MSVEASIKKSLATATINAVNAITVPTLLPIKFPLLTFKVPDDNRYVEYVHIRNNIDNEFWGSEKTYRGIVRLLVHWSIDDQGDMPALRYCDLLAEQFPKGSQFENGGVIVKLFENPDLGSLVEAAPDAFFPLTLQYMYFRATS